MVAGQLLDGRQRRQRRQPIIQFWIILTTRSPSNTGCGIFKRGIQNLKVFWLKINCSQMKLPNFDNWSNGELSKIGYHFRK
jgi:hypothetical protein